MKMTMELLRGKAARSVATATVVALTLAVSTVFAQPAPSPGARAGMDDPATMASLQKRDGTAPSPIAGQPAGQSAGEPVKLNPGLAAAEKVAATPAGVEDQYSPLKVALMVLGGILLCALATAGLVLTIGALRKDIKRRKRAQRRRLEPFSGDSAIPAAHRWPGS
jgi:hypothetical protein